MGSRVRRLLDEWGEHIAKHGWADPLGVVTIDPRLVSKADRVEDAHEIDLDCLEALDALSRD